MPYCPQCGRQVRETDQFCGACGARQPGAASDGVSPRTASMLCYIPWVGWIAAILVLASQRFRHEATVRFHAFQGIYLFVVWLIVDWILGPVGVFSAWRGVHRPWPGVLPVVSMVGLLKLVILAAWIFMLVKTSRNEKYRLPVLGELAERSVAEQK